ncbi:hypothetical protein GCM10010279_28440 [Streptomyces mutabilis]|nr:hypothetical protein GCM10010279_28440 [Streptomyces mutabilis]
MGYGLSSVTTFLLLRADPYHTPRILTWLSGTAYGRTFSDVVPVAAAVAPALPVLLAVRGRLDLIAVDEDTPRIVGVGVERTRLAAPAVAAVRAALSVIAVGVVCFVGLVAPHLGGQWWAPGTVAPFRWACCWAGCWCAWRTPSAARSSPPLRCRRASSSPWGGAP